MPMAMLPTLGIQKRRQENIQQQKGNRNSLYLASDMLMILSVNKKHTYQTVMGRGVGGVRVSMTKKKKNPTGNKKRKDLSVS